MKKLTSQTLEILSKALGISGPMSPVTELADATVDQVLDISPIVRRSRTQAKSGGIYTAILRNVHTDAESLTSTIIPYNAGALARPPYPSVMPAGFDVWLLFAAVTQLSGGGTLSAALRVNCPASVMGISAVGSQPTVQNVGFWDTVVAEATTFGVQSGTTHPGKKIGMRLPRDNATTIVFGSTSSLTATFDCFVTLGVFPVALGQDVLI